MRKIHVFVDASGTILGSTPAPGTTSPQGTVFVAGIPQDTSGFQVVEVEPWSDDVLGSAQFAVGGPSARSGEGSVEALHRRLAEHIRANDLPDVGEYLNALRQDL